MNKKKSKVNTDVAKDKQSIHIIEDRSTDKPIGDKITGFLSDGKKANAKNKQDEIVSKIEGDSYYIKCNVKNRPYNPFDAFAQKEDVQLTLNKGDYPYKMLKVSKGTFDHYMKFIETRMDVHFKIAFKEIVEMNNHITGTFVMTKEHSTLNGGLEGIHRI